MNRRIRKKRESVTMRALLAELAERFATPEEAIEWLSNAQDEIDGRAQEAKIAAHEIERVAFAIEALPIQRGLAA